MRGIKLEKSHIHILESETLRRESKVTESAQEIVCSIPCIITHIRTNILFVNTFILLLWGCFTRMWEVCGVLSDCEELVGEGKPNRFRWEICRHCVVETPEYLNFQFAF